MGLRVAGEPVGVKGRFATGLRPEPLDTDRFTGWWKGMNDLFDEVRAMTWRLFHPKTG